MSDSKSGKRVHIVIPFLNEKDNLPLLYDRLVKVFESEQDDFEIIFVDDGSTDASPDWVRDKAREDARVKMIRMSRNFGHQIAITAGIDYASGDAIIVMDADLQDPPEVIPDLLEKWRQGFEVVYAVRKSREGETWSKKFLAASFYRLFKHLTHLDVPMDAGDFRLVGRRAADSLKEVRELHRFVRGLTSWVGYPQCAVYYERAARHAGETKYPVLKSLNLALDALTSFSGKPLRWIMGMGGFVSAGGVVMMIWVIAKKLMFPEALVRGWTSLFALVMFLGGLQLVCMGFLGQYVSRIFEESKKRPLYFVKDLIGEFESHD